MEREYDYEGGVKMTWLTDGEKEYFKRKVFEVKEVISVYENGINFEKENEDGEE